MTIDETTLSILLGVALPVLVALLTKVHASSRTKAVLNAGLAAVAGALALVVPGATIDLKALLVSVGIAWASSMVTYLGIYKPSGATDAVQWRTGSFGLG